MEWLVSLLTLTILEIVLGIDNIIFISILTDKLPAVERRKIQRLGLLLALVFRIILLLSISWLLGLTEALFTLGPWTPSTKDLVLLGGGLFLLAKTTSELHTKVNHLEHRGDPADHDSSKKKAAKAGAWLIAQIVLIDMVFSFDSSSLRKVIWDFDGRHVGFGRSNRTVHPKAAITPNLGALLPDVDWIYALGGRLPL